MYLNFGALDVVMLSFCPFVFLCYSALLSFCYLVVSPCGRYVDRLRNLVASLGTSRRRPLCHIVAGAEVGSCSRFCF